MVLSTDQVQSEPRQYGFTYTGDFNSLPWSTAFPMETDGKEEGVGKDRALATTL